MRQVNARRRRRGFTTIELLVVIGIIVVLIGILIPVVGKVREKARETGTAAWISQLSGAIEAYYSDFKAYPGPMSNDEIRNENMTTVKVNFVTPWPADYAAAGGNTDNGRARFTMSENLVLGLLGGLKLDTSTPPQIVYDPTLVGNGPMSLNPAQPKRYQPYMDATTANLSWKTVGNDRTGAYFDDASGPGGADDSIVPEFLDTFTDPLPVIYARAKAGSQRNPNNNGKFDNPVMTDDGTAGDGTFRAGQYDISQIRSYTMAPSNASGAIGVGRKLPRYVVDGTPTSASANVHGLTSPINTARVLGPENAQTYTYPYDAFAYFRDPSLSNKQPPAGGTGYVGPHVARQKDKYILISAGTDRIYGTNDDITNFGAIVPQ
jgi:type II secretory pathway pseudopilin PulG